MFVSDVLTRSTGLSSVSTAEISSGSFQTALSAGSSSGGCFIVVAFVWIGSVGLHSASGAS